MIYPEIGERDTRGLWAGPERRRKPPFGHHRCSFAHNPNAASATGLIRNRPLQGQVPRLLFITVVDETIARDAENIGSGPARLSYTRGPPTLSLKAGHGCRADKW